MRGKLHVAHSSSLLVEKEQLVFNKSYELLLSFQKSFQESQKNDEKNGRDWHRKFEEFLVQK